MSDFRKVTEYFWASPQIGMKDLEDAKAQGFALIVNNRPDGESPDQVDGAAIAQAASAAGLDYRAIPITHAGFGEAEIDAMRGLLENTPGKVLAYCRSGTRSTFLWALARASMGDDPESLARAAAPAGYDLGPIRQAMDRLASRQGG